MKFLQAVLVVFALASSSLAASIDTAMNHFARSDFAAAIAELESYVAENPGDSHGLFLLGYAYYEAGRMEEAMKQFKSAYLVDPEFTPPVPPSSTRKQ